MSLQIPLTNTMLKLKFLLPLAALLIAILLIAACGSVSTPAPSPGDTRGEEGLAPTQSPGKSELSPPTGEGDAEPTPEAPEQPWPQPDLLTPSPKSPEATPTPVSHSCLRPRHHLCPLRPHGSEPLAHRLFQALRRLRRNPPRTGPRRHSRHRLPQVRARL